MKEVVELETILPKWSNKSYYKDFKKLLDDNILFIYFKNKKLYYFCQYTNPKVSFFEGSFIKCLLSSKEITNDSDIKNYHLVMDQLLETSNSLKSLSKSLFENLKRENLSQSEKSELRLNLSNYCTLNCKYCFQKEKNSLRLNLEDCYKQVDSFLKENPNIKHFKITLCMTSEPFLDLDKIKSIYYYVQQKCLEKLKNETTKQELYEFLNIKSDEEYNKLLEYRDYYKSAFSNMDSRFISETLQSKLRFINFYKDIEKIKEINEEVIYSALSASKNMYYIWFCTNGTIIPDERGLSFLKLLFAKSPLGISLDGNYFSSKSRVFPDGKSSYKKVINTIKVLQKNGIQLEVHCTITNKNCNFIKLIKFYEKLGFKKIYFGIEKGAYSKAIIKNIQKVFHAYRVGKLKDIYNLKEYIDTINSKTIYSKCCPAYGYKCIGYDNKTYYCDYFISKKCGPLNDKISIFNRDECKDCKFNFLCGGTCLALTNGELKKHNNQCLIKQELIKQAIFSSL